jgi:hypothetical protein
MPPKPLHDLRLYIRKTNEAKGPVDLPSVLHVGILLGGFASRLLLWYTSLRGHS